jgi:hypothetical protein
MPSTPVPWCVAVTAVTTMVDQLARWGRGLRAARDITEPVAAWA